MNLSEKEKINKWVKQNLILKNYNLYQSQQLMIKAHQHMVMQSNAQVQYLSH